MDFETSEEQRMLRRTIRKFTDQEISPRAMEMETLGKLPDDLIKKMAYLGLLGMNLPEAYGGSLSTSLECVLAIEQLSHSGTGAWWLAAFGNSIPETVFRFGTEQQKARSFLPPVPEMSTPVFSSPKPTRAPIRTG